MELIEDDVTENEHQMKKEVQRTASVLSRKESSRRKPHKIDRVQIADLFEPDENDVTILPRKHVLETLDFDQPSMSNVVTSELRDLGVDLDSGSRQSRSKSRKPAAVVHSIVPDQFLESVEVTLNKTAVRLCVPHVITQTCEFIRKDITVEGIFRKSGSTSRVQSLKQRFSEKDTDVFNAEDTVIDAAVVLKTYLRELPAPLIPYEVHAILLKCFDHPDERSRVEAILMCVYMLPLPNIHILVYLMAFLHEVVKHSHQNRMGYKNLALILTPNIMPVDEKKGLPTGKESIIALEKNRKVIEIMILYGDFIGWVPIKLQKAVEVQLIYRNSDDELETDRHLGRDGRRKKRRSGSLTRMFGFLRKVTNSKGGDTPSSTVDTPGDYGLHTPVLKGSTKKRANDEPMFSTQKNPMRAEWKNPMPNLNTPNIVRDKRSKSTPDNARVPLSSAAKSSSKHNRLGFGRKSGKKVAMLHQQAQRNLQRSELTTSVVSIHNLQDSPRKRLSRNITDDELSVSSSTGALNEEIPPPPQFSDTPHVSDGGCFASQESIAANDNGDGTYVTIAPTATTDDVPNEAFIASSGSLDLTDGDATSCENLNDESGSSREFGSGGRNSLPVESLRLTPLIKEINTLTLFAQQDIILPVKSMENLDHEHAKVEEEYKGNVTDISRADLPVTEKPPTSLEEVAKEFKRTLREEKIIKLQQEMKGVSPSLSRRESLVGRGMSPSRRKINSFRRRRSHDSAKGTPPVAQSPRFMSLRSPRSRPVPPPPSRSPARCTLRRGRPNTAWTGLPRPSPSRAGSQGTSGRSPRFRVVYSSSNIRDRVILRDSGNVISPVMRRMSSVQELVHRLEKKAKISKGLPVDDCGEEATRDRRSLPSNSGTWHVEEHLPPPEILEDSMFTPHYESCMQTDKRSTPNQGNEWVNGDSFNFDDDEAAGEPVATPKPPANRESIHYLKTRNAGKVSANVRMFDGMVSRKSKSPSGTNKSMIPRYTALHSRPQTKP